MRDDEAKRTEMRSEPRGADKEPQRRRGGGVVGVKEEVEEKLGKTVMMKCKEKFMEGKK